MDSERTFLERPQERLLKWLAVGLISLVGFEALAVATAMPTVVRSLEGENLYALAMGIPMATQLIATALAGPWSDNRSPQSCLYTGVFLFVVGLTICTFSPSPFSVQSVLPLRPSLCAITQFAAFRIFEVER